MALNYWYVSIELRPDIIHKKARTVAGSETTIFIVFKWWSRGGSNSRPRHCERRALPSELRPQSARIVAIRKLIGNI